MLNRQNSAISIMSSGNDFCRICHCDSSCGELISPCYCSGSLKWVHQACLQHWIRASNSKACELCRYPFTMRSKLKPIYQWEVLPMTSSQKRRSCCSALFHIIAISCVTWSLYVLIDRTIEEYQQPELEWQFWTKIVVEAIGCVGFGILIYVWGKLYFSLIRKWIAFNRTFVIINSSPAPLKQKPSIATATATTNTTSTKDSSPPLYHECQSNDVMTNTDCYCCSTATTDAIVDMTNPSDKTSAECNNCEVKPLLLPSSVVFSDSGDPDAQHPDKV